MAEANPNGFDYYRRAEVLKGLRAKANPSGFDYYRRAETLQTMLIPSGAFGYRTLLGAGV